MRQAHLVIGCPVRRRELTISGWVRHAAAGAEWLGVEEVTLLLVGPVSDPSFDRAMKTSTELGLNLRIVETDEPQSPVEEHHWPAHRIAEMVHVRNPLLEQVRAIGPELFLSIDSDVMLHPASLVDMVETMRLGGHDAVGGKTYLGPYGRYVPNYARLSGDGLLRRPDSVAVERADVLMAVKLMRRKAYDVDYEFHRWGEDVGWSLACARRGLGLAWDGRAANVHLM